VKMGWHESDSLVEVTQARLLGEKSQRRCGAVAGHILPIGQSSASLAYLTPRVHRIARTEACLAMAAVRFDASELWDDAPLTKC
jgi:hypothetical protein